MGGKSGQKSRQAGLRRFALILFGAILVILVVGFAIAQGIGQSSVPSGDVVSVEGISEGDSTVSEAEYKRALGQAIAQAVSQGSLKKPPKPGTTRYEELQATALGGLIDRIWILGEAEELGLTATSKQVEAELEKIKEQNFPTAKAWAEFLKTSKLSQEDVDRQVELQVLSKQIQSAITAKAPAPSEDEVADFYESAKATQFTTKPTRDVRLVTNKDKAEVEAAKAELEKDNSPASWKKVAAKYSSDPSTKSKGGLQPALTEELLATAGPLEGAVFDSAVNELVGPIKFRGNYTIVEVVKLSEEKVQPLAEVRETIASQLKTQAEERVFEKFVTNYQSKWESRTLCASGFEIERCSNFPAAKRLAKAREPYKTCYEANPKTPPKECPAPVVQNTPALPGSVTVLQPNGTRLPQRPVSAGASSPTAGGASEALPPGGAEAPGE